MRLTTLGVAGGGFGGSIEPPFFSSAVAIVLAIMKHFLASCSAALQQHFLFVQYNDTSLCLGMHKSLWCYQESY